MDMMLYEVCFICQMKGEDGVPVIRSFDSVLEVLEGKLDLIYEETWADEEPLLYLTGSNFIKKAFPRYKDMPINFREEVAVTKPYKGNRKKNEKPFHYENLTVHAIQHLNVKIAWGMEADDLICADHLADKDNTIRCTRDKDFKGSPGWLYGWETTRQSPFPSTDIDVDTADKFFFTQMLTGDTTDNIPGLPRVGEKTARDILDGVNGWDDLMSAVKKVYKDKGFGRDYFVEQGNLLWMSRELHEDGSPVIFEEVLCGK